VDDSAAHPEPDKSCEFRRGRGSLGLRPGQLAWPCWHNPYFVQLGFANHTSFTPITVLQGLGEKPNGWIILNPSDAETFDLIPRGSGRGLLTGGFESANSGQLYGSADNVFGASAQRVISPSVPQDTALVADWRQIRLSIRKQTTILVNAFGVELHGQHRHHASVGGGSARKDFATATMMRHCGTGSKNWRFGSAPLIGWYKPSGTRIL
jgi:hypothetical protein